MGLPANLAKLLPVRWVSHHLERPSWWLTGVSATLLVVGILGWIGSRVLTTLADWRIQILSSSILVLGMAMFTLIGLVNAFRFPRPWLVKLLSVSALLWAGLLAAGSFTATLKIPIIIVGVMVVILMIVSYWDVARRTDTKKAPSKS